MHAKTASAGGMATVVQRSRRGAVPAAIVVLAAALVVVPAVRAYDAPPDLNSVARVYSLGVGEVRCSSQAEWDGDRHGPSVSWAYTNLSRGYSVLAPIVCEGASNVGTAFVPLWQQAFGVLVLVHEAFHLRQWRFRRNEAKVSCQAIVHFTDAAKRLGADDEQANELYPYALALHLRQTQLYSWYRDPKCLVPPWVPPMEPSRLALGRYACAAGVSRNSSSSYSSRGGQRLEGAGGSGSVRCGTSGTAR